MAGISGLTDVDAITLSAVQLVNSSQLEPDTAWRVILLATLSNLVFKGAAVAALGSRPLFVRVAVMFSIALAAGIAILAAWPGV